MKTKAIIVTLLLAMSATQALASEVIQVKGASNVTNLDYQKYQLAKQLVKLDGSEQIVRIVNEQTVVEIKKQAPFLSTDFLKNMKYTLDKGYNSNIIARAYAETYDREELQALITFYQTNIGKKIVQKSDKIAKYIIEKQVTATENAMVGLEQAMIKGMMSKPSTHKK